MPKGWGMEAVAGREAMKGALGGHYKRTAAYVVDSSTAVDSPKLIG